MHKVPRPYIIDVEASGFGAKSYPIEVGVVIDQTTKYCALISPDPAWDHWDPEAQSIHSISYDTLLSHGKPIAVVANELNALLADKTVYSDGWVVDKPWLSYLFQTAGIPMKFAISPLELLLSEIQMENWHTTKDTILEETNYPRHRASYDAWIIQETFYRTYQMNKSL